MSRAGGRDFSIDNQRVGFSWTDLDLGPDGPHSMTYFEAVSDRISPLRGATGRCYQR